MDIRRLAPEDLPALLMLYGHLHRTDDPLSSAWAAGCYKVMLLTGRRDEATRRFHRSAGFDPDGKQAFLAKPES